MQKLRKLREDTRRYFRQLSYAFAQVGFRPASLAPPFLLAAVVSICEAASAALAIPLLAYLMERNIDTLRRYRLINGVIEATGAGELAIFTSLMLCAGGAIVLRLLCQFASSLTMLRIVRRTANNLRQAIYARYLRFGKLYFDEHNTGQLHQSLTVYVDTIAMELWMMNNTVNSLFMLAAYMTVMFSVSPALTLIGFIVFPALHMVTKVLIHRIRMASHSLKSSYNNMGKQISNALLCMPLVRSYANEEKEQEWFAGLSSEVMTTQLRIDTRNLMIPPIREIAILGILGCGVIVFILGPTLGLSIEIAPSLVFLFVVRRASYHLTTLDMARAHLASVSGHIQELNSIFKDEGKHIVPGGPRQFEGLKDGIRFSGLSFEFPSGARALDDVSLEIPKGSKIAIVGESGAGKTTIVNLLLRYYDCEPGRILVDGVDIRELEIRGWRSAIAEVSQNAHILNASLKTNLTYGCKREIDDDELAEALSLAGLTDFVARLPLGLSTQIGDMGVTLSGGEKQRLSIARTILKRAEILILDEATSSLDSLTERAIARSLDTIMKGKTVIIVAHRLASVSKVDKIFVMERGRVVESGAPRELIERKGRFYAYWAEQRGEE